MKIIGHTIREKINPSRIAQSCPNLWDVNLKIKAVLAICNCCINNSGFRIKNSLILVSYLIVTLFKYVCIN